LHLRMFDLVVDLLATLLQALDLLAHAIAVFKRVMSPTRSNSEKPS